MSTGLAAKGEGQRVGVAALDSNLSDELADLRIPVYFKPVGADDLLALTRRLLTATIH